MICDEHAISLSKDALLGQVAAGNSHFDKEKCLTMSTTARIVKIPFGGLEQDFLLSFLVSEITCVM